MPWIDSLKKEVAILNKALPVDNKPHQQEQTTKLLFHYDKLIELIRNPNPEEQARLTLESIHYHPATYLELNLTKDFLN